MILLILWLALLGVVVWAVTTYIPMPPQFRTLIIVVAIILVLIWLVGILGVEGPPIPRLR